MVSFLQGWKVLLTLLIHYVNRDNEKKSHRGVFPTQRIWEEIIERRKGIILKKLNMLGSKSVLRLLFEFIWCWLNNRKQLLNIYHFPGTLIPFGWGVVFQYLVSTGPEINVGNWRGLGRRGEEIKVRPGSKGPTALGSQGGSWAIDSPWLPFPDSLFNKHPGLPSQVLRQHGGPGSNNKESRGREYLALREERQASVRFGGVRDRNRGGKYWGFRTGWWPQMAPSFPAGAAADYTFFYFVLFCF